MPAEPARSRRWPPARPAGPAAASPSGHGDSSRLPSFGHAGPGADGAPADAIHTRNGIYRFWYGKGLVGEAGRRRLTQSLESTPAPPPPGALPPASTPARAARRPRTTPPPR